MFFISTREQSLQLQCLLSDYCFRVSALCLEGNSGRCRFEKRLSTEYLCLVNRNLSFPSGKQTEVIAVAAIAVSPSAILAHWVTCIKERL